MCGLSAGADISRGITVPVLEVISVLTLPQSGVSSVLIWAPTLGIPPPAGSSPRARSSMWRPRGPTM